MSSNGVYISMVRPVIYDDRPSEPYGTILGIYGRHYLASDAIKQYYRKIAKDCVGGRVEWLDDLTAKITSTKGDEITYVGSILKKPLIWPQKKED